MHVELLEAHVWLWNVVTFATFYWPKEITRPTSVQGVGRWIIPLKKGGEKSHCKGCGDREG